MNSELAWFKSSHSGTEGGACVEIALAPGTVHVRDSKDRTGPQLCFTPEAWADFIRLAREVSPLDR
ncbi:DUF397 domain-containing protein [Kitasatospora aureofaciens]|uniref:DUF397 domain-containing protein n=1 Tax=Kitasatospora aureofaciens TaxID=1894 RepID=UPI001D8B029F|nr:DUF397 domain-containing protein [Kitasatospora aureofaciens]HJD82608.1 DUF397 domain-containing protein [Kitasatospora aureofaciens]